MKKVLLFLFCFIISFSFFNVNAYADSYSNVIVNYSSSIPDTGSWVYNQTNTLNLKYNYSLSGDLYEDKPYFFRTDLLATNTTNYNYIINYYNNINYNCNLLGFLTYDVILGQTNVFYLKIDYKPIAVNGGSSKIIHIYHCFDINSLEIVSSNGSTYDGNFNYSLDNNSFNISFDNVGVVLLDTSISSYLNFVVGGGVYPFNGGLGSLFFDFSDNGIIVLDTSILSRISLYKFNINNNFNLTTFIDMDYTSQYFVKTFAFYGAMQTNYLGSTDITTLNNFMTFSPVLKDTFNNDIISYDGYSSSMVLQSNDYFKSGIFTSRDEDFIIDRFVYTPSSYNVYTNTNKSYDDLIYLSFTTGFNSSLSQFDINSFWGSSSDMSKTLYKDVAWYDIFGHLYNFLIYLVFDMPIFSNVFKIFGYFVFSFVELVSYIVTSFSSIPFLFPLLFCFVLFTIFLKFLF